MRYLILTLLYLISCTSLQAQLANFNGAVYFDSDTNCIVSAGDQPMIDIIIEATETNTNATYYATTSYFQNGNFNLNVPAGVYSVKANLPYDHPYASFCQNNIIRTIAAGQSDSILFFATPNSYSPLMQADISSPGLPDCGNATYYVKYRNYGTASAFNASLDVEFDTSITILNASSTFTSLGNNRYFFPLNQVFLDRDTLGIIRIDVDIDCSLASPGQTHFAKATISPEPIINYNGPLLKTEADCQGGNIAFRTANIGNINAALTTSLIVIEDDVMYSEPVIGPLDTINEDTLNILVGPGQMYRLQSQQFAGVPELLSDPIQWSAIEGCTDTLGGFNTTSFRQYYTEDARPHVSYDYQNGGDTINFNKIRSQLEGYGPNRLVDQNVPLEYQIRFKNYSSSFITGVTIRDSLPIYLDLNSLKINTLTELFYDFRIENDRELVIEMPSLILAPGEDGFVSFSVNQVLNNPLGTVIEHRAQIIMNNDTTLTPMIFHTIGENYIRVLSQQSLSQEQWEVRVYPNPMQDYATFELEGAELEEMILEIYNMQGQRIKRLSSSNSLIQLQRDQLSAGYYAYQVLADGKAVNSGKLLVR